MNLSPRVFAPLARSSRTQYLRLGRSSRGFCRRSSEPRAALVVRTSMTGPRREDSTGYSQEFGRGSPNDYGSVEEFEGVILRVAGVGYSPRIFRVFLINESLTVTV